MILNEAVEGEVTKAQPRQAADLITEGGAHAADLAVAALGQDDVEAVIAKGLHATGLGGCGIADIHPFNHGLNKGGVVGPVDLDPVFLLLAGAASEQAVDDAAIVCQKEEPGGFNIQAAYIKDALLVANARDDVVGHGDIGGADDPHRLVINKINRRATLPDGLAIHLYIVDIGIDPGAQYCDLIIDKDSPLLNEIIGLAPGAVDPLSEVFIEAHRRHQWLRAPGRGVGE